MKRRSFNKIIEKIINKKASSQEVEIFDEWLNSINHKSNSDWSDHELELLSEKALQQVNSKRGFRWAYAAGAAILLIIGTWLFIPKPNLDEFQSIKQQVSSEPIKAGGFNGLLTTHGKESISLASLQLDSLYVFEDVQVERLDSGLVRIIPLPSSQVSWQEIRAPKGANLAVILEDGSKITLNANSMISFPSRFDPNGREVVMEGEAFFEVQKEKTRRPFEVRSGQNVINVLGTKFNVNTKSENEMQASLYEGRIQVSNGNFRVVLDPGKEILIAKNGTYQVQIFDKNKSTAWKAGVFDLKGKNIKQIMKEVGDWYNVEVEYLNADTNVKYMGELSKFSNIETLLETISLVKGNQFEIKERRIIVK
ncbi:FecR family protein [Sphingobacterium sp. BN32]|uniref:FecR family protein n=1 Tax=Sphingobacterium sp. BN32 TaxID=3058432 RepID=UPI00265D28C2|nr:FecR domain-containing protein [Sphingobacterium sp. BN32]WKK56873.1 FecR domain-containing protein [Sphingobacterium sp. BN32]